MEHYVKPARKLPTLSAKLKTTCRHVWNVINKLAVHNTLIGRLMTGPGGDFRKSLVMRHDSGHRKALCTEYAEGAGKLRNKESS